MNFSIEGGRLNNLLEAAISHFHFSRACENVISLHTVDQKNIFLKIPNVDITIYGSIAADIYSDGFAYFKSRDLLKIVYRRSLDDEIFFFEIMEDKLRIKIDNLAIGTIPILHYSTCLNRSDIEYIPKKFEVTGGIFGKFGQLIDSFGGVKSQSIEAWMPFMLENDQEAIEIMIPMRCFEKIEDMESSFLESLIFYVYEDRILLKYCNIGIAFEKKIVKKQQCQ